MHLLYKPRNILFIQHKFIAVEILPLLPSDPLPKGISHLVALKCHQADLADALLLQGFHSCPDHAVANAVVPVFLCHAYVVKAACSAVMAAKDISNDPSVLDSHHAGGRVAP